ncbi:MAG: hypothetical protein ACLU4J_14740 [Butyricimonas paravirosa]
MMDAYLLYSDMKFLDVALDAAYEILIPKGSDKIVLPCRTPNICRLLCNYYYFTGEDECALLVKGLVVEAMGKSSSFTSEEIITWWKALFLCESMVMECEEGVYHERIRMEVKVVQWEDEKIEVFRCVAEDFYLIAEIFEILARREFLVYNENYK